MTRKAPTPVPPGAIKPAPPPAPPPPPGRLMLDASYAPEVSDDEWAILGELTDPQKLAVGHAIRVSSQIARQLERDRFRDERDTLLQLVREALHQFDEHEVFGTIGVIDIRDWVKSAEAAIAKAEGGGQ